MTEHDANCELPRTAAPEFNKPGWCDCSRRAEMKEEHGIDPWAGIEELERLLGDFHD